jgi:hypothetical protein
MRLTIPLRSVIALAWVVVAGCGGHDHGSGEVGAGAVSVCNQGSSSDRGAASDPGTASDPGSSVDPGTSGESKTGAITTCVGGNTTCGAGMTCGADRGRPGVCLPLCHLGGSECGATADCVGQGSPGALGVCLDRCETVDGCTRGCGLPVRCATLGATSDGAPAGGASPTYCLYSSSSSTGQPGAPSGG